MMSRLQELQVAIDQLSSYELRELRDYIDKRLRILTENETPEEKLVAIHAALEAIRDGLTPLELETMIAAMNDNEDKLRELGGIPPKQEKKRSVF